MWSKRLLASSTLWLLKSTMMVPVQAQAQNDTSLAPSLMPSLWPSSMPTESLNETDIPTATPTLAPINVATAAPTINPTATPSASPVNTTAPTPAVILITGTPTMTPTLNQTAPTGFPTSFPTMPSNDTMIPVVNETMAPSTSPSMNATTEMPTVTPTMAMTTAPTTDNATAMPTAAPTMSSMPSTSTMAPTSMPVRVGEPVAANISGIAMTLLGVGELNAPAQAIWTSVTRDFYLEIYNNRRRNLLLRGRGGGGGQQRNLQVQGVSDLDTIVKYVDQGVTADGNTIIYDQEISYTSISEADVLDVIVEPFNDPDIVTAYVNDLKAADGVAFGGLTGVEAPNIQEPPDDDDDGLSGAAIGGICAGGAVLLIAGGYFLMRGNGGGGTHERLPASNEPPATFSALQSEEVSTMEDPNLGRVTGSGEPGSMLDVGDQSVATVDYDYSKAYGGADNSVVSSAGGTMGENTRETGSALQTSARAALGASFDSEGKPDANVREEVIEINAPAGKLGVVIDTPDEGAPVVHAVKDSSVIADLIQVGDKLVAVDDEDVTAMTAIKVSKLISKKSANPSRKLTVIRQVVVEE